MKRKLTSYCLWSLEVVEFTQWIYIHLEWASMISKNIFSIKEAASMYTQFFSSNKIGIQGFFFYL